jgi:hypothetical protein
MWYGAVEGMSAPDGETAAKIVPFPAARRVGFIRTVAALMLSYRPDAAERTLNARLDATRSAMLRRGLAPEVVTREIRALEWAIRAKLWTIVMQGGDAA